MLAAHVLPGSMHAAVGAAGVGAAVDVAYVLAVQGREAGIESRVAFYAAFVGVMAALSLAGAAVGRLDERFAQALLYGAATGYLLAGVVGLASVGLLLIPGGLLALIAAGPRRVSIEFVAAMVVIPASVLVIGMALP